MNRKLKGFYPVAQAMTKMKAGARLGIAVAIDAEVCVIPSKNNHWNRVTLFQTHKSLLIN